MRAVWLGFLLPALTASSLPLLLLLPQTVGINAIHVNPTRPWQFAVGGSDAWARVYDIRKTRDPPQNPSGSGSSSSSCTAGRGSSLAAAAAAAAACYGRDRFWQRDNSSSSAPLSTQQPQEQCIGPPTRAEARYSRVYGFANEPVARLCPEGLWGSRVGGFGDSPSITCVMFSKQGELLASYNDAVSGLFICCSLVGLPTRHLKLVVSSWLDGY
jgi:hypothetical protein